MIKKRRFPKIFFGWWTVLASGIMTFWAAGFQVYGFSALFKPISSELNFSRAVASGPAAITRLEGGFEGPIAGWATDRFGPRWVMLFGVFFVGLSLILMYFVNSLWAFYAIWGVMLGTAFNILGSIPADTAITNWFVKKRGRALGIKKVIDGLSGVIVLPLVAWLIIAQGWRMTCFIGGVVMLAIGVPLTWFFLRRHRPEYYGLLPDGATLEEEAADVDGVIERGVEYAGEAQEVEFTLRQAMRTRTYWLLLLTQASHSLAMPAINIHAIPFLTDMGIDPLVAAGMMALMVAASIPFRFIGGFVADRVSKDHLRFLIGASFIMQALGFTVFLLNQTIPMIYAWFILYGIGMGAAFTINIAVGGRYFGRKAFGFIRGTSMMFVTPFGIVAPIYCGWIYDTTGSYITAFTLVAVLVALSGVVVCFIKPPKPPVEGTDVRRIM